MSIKKVIGITIGVLSIVGVGLLKAVSRSDDMYSDSWFEIATDDELREEREKIRLKHISGEEDSTESTRSEHLLRKFDRVMSDRAWGDEEPHPSAYHREHGYYLPNDEQ